MNCLKHYMKISFAQNNIKCKKVNIYTEPGLHYTSKRHVNKSWTHRLQTRHSVVNCFLSYIRHELLYFCFFSFFFFYIKLSLCIPNYF